MSYVDEPELNPYAAPVSKIEDSTGLDASRYVGYATFWQRFVAYIIDNIIIGIIGFVVGLVVAALVIKPGDSQSAMTAQIIAQLVSLAISLAYYAGMESSASQATVGKQAMGLRVTDLYGRRISFGRATGRFFGKIISGLILCIGYLMIAWTEKKQGLHDIMAGTLVLKTR